MTLTLEMPEVEARASVTDGLAMIVHDLRTPLSALKQALQIIESRRAGELTAAQERFVGMALDNAQVLERLLADLRGFKEGAVPLRRTRLRAAAPAEFVLRALGAEAEHRGIALELQDDSRGCDAWADEELVRRVLLNLVGNALDYAADDGRVVVSVGRDPADAAFVLLRVCDDGPGIAPEHHERVFERYYSVRSHAPRRAEGTGLGLAIVREIAEAHGGAAWVRNNGTRGCTFHVRLPAFGGCTATT